MHEEEKSHHMSTTDDSDQLTQVYTCSNNACEFKVCANPTTCICH